MNFRAPYINMFPIISTVEICYGLGEILIFILSVMMITLAIFYIP